MAGLATSAPKLRLLPREAYRDVKQSDPLRFYFMPIIGRMYRRRVELCLAECAGGQRVLEVGFGAGATFLNLHEMYDEIYGLDLTASVERVRRAFAARKIETYLQNGDVVDMPYEGGFFETVLLISILEHLKPYQQADAFAEIRRVLKPGGQVVYGVPIERPLMVFAFRCLGYNIREHHFSTEEQVRAAAREKLEEVRVVQMRSGPAPFGNVYEVGHFVKAT